MGWTVQGLDLCGVTFSGPIHTSLKAQSAYYTMGTRSVSWWGVSGQVVAMTIQSYRKSIAVPLLPLVPAWHVVRPYLILGENIPALFFKHEVCSEGI